MVLLGILSRNEVRSGYEKFKQRQIPFARFYQRFSVEKTIHLSYFRIIFVIRRFNDPWTIDETIFFIRN